jgi:cytochrome c553
LKNPLWVLIIALLAVPLIGTAAPQQEKEGPLPWAYAGNAPPNVIAYPLSDKSLKHVPGSDLSFTIDQIRNPFGPADWHPSDHGPMPDIVAHGKEPGVNACALCHLPNGKGRAENAPVSGLPVEYFVQQMMDFKNGLRRSAEPRKGNAIRMAAFAKAMTDDEIRAVAEYFGSIPWTPWIKVVETNTVPKTRVLSDGLYLKIEGNQTEPIGNRIVEVPENTEATAVLRDDHSPFIAYAPIGSIKKGEALVTTGGGGKTVQCEICHGAHLEGIGPVPPIAGHSPSYIARQLYDMQHGTRKGLWSGLMQRAVEKLTSEDIVAICAYISSRPVPAAAKGASGEAPVAPAAKAAVRAGESVAAPITQRIQ